WRNSSSSSRFQTLEPYCSPSDSMRTAARSGPVSALAGALACDCRLANVATRFSVSDGPGAAVAMIAQSARGGVQPLTNDGECFLRVAFGELADLLHRLGVNLALDLGNVDHLRGGARRDFDGRIRCKDRGGRRSAGQELAGFRRRRLRRDDAANKRAH